MEVLLFILAVLILLAFLICRLESPFALEFQPRSVGGQYAVFSIDAFGNCCQETDPMPYLQAVWEAHRLTKAQEDARAARNR